MIWYVLSSLYFSYLQVQANNNFTRDVNQTSCQGQLDNGGYYYGYRYSDPADEVLSLLYDVQDTIAGVQAWVMTRITRITYSCGYEQRVYQNGFIIWFIANP